MSSTNTSVAETPKTNPINIAVIGGGIGGLSLALGLLKHKHLNVQVYEAAHTFGEIGAGVAIGPNSQRALKLIGPHAYGAFEKHATGSGWESYADVDMEHIGKGEQDGTVICQEKTKGGMQSVHRAHFLDELVKGVPPGCAHFNKRLISLEEKEGGGIVLHFKDGTTATADAVIGADGIHSVTREYILGDKDPSCHAVFAGSVAYRALAPMDKAVEKLGDKYASNSMVLCGPGKAILSYPIDLGKILNIVVMDFEYPIWESEKSILPATKAQLDALFVGWGPTAHHLIELMDNPNLTMWAMRDDLPCPTYTLGNVAMMGDAAHATTPYQGQGAGQATEDALVLETLLGKVHDPKLIPNAFAAYDEVRRPRSQRVVKTSRESGMLISMQTPGVGSDLDKIREKTETRMHWIWNRDMEKQNADALALFEEGL
ncbi:hypothetical protein BDR22DRAFT_814573 [Usnea florida]